MKEVFSKKLKKFKTVADRFVIHKERKKSSISVSSVKSICKIGKRDTLRDKNYSDQISKEWPVLLCYTEKLSENLLRMENEKFFSDDEETQGKY